MQGASQWPDCHRQSLPRRMDTLSISRATTLQCACSRICGSQLLRGVDQHNTLGLGANVPIATGNANEGLLALVDGKFVTLRVPYPLGFYAKGMDGRIDDPNAGWKGRGIWTTTGNRTPFHLEGGKGTRPKVVHLQLRPDPLAR